MGPAVEILLVEDNPGDVRLIHEAFRMAGRPHRMQVARDGAEALACLRRQPPFADSPRPDLVLLDLNLPKLSGQEVLAAVKADADLRRIPVVVLTSSQDESDMTQSYDLHANAYVAKPVTLEGLVDIVRALDSFWFDAARLPPR